MSVSMSFHDIDAEHVEATLRRARRCLRRAVHDLRRLSEQTQWTSRGLRALQDAIASLHVEAIVHLEDFDAVPRPPYAR